MREVYFIEGAGLIKIGSSSSALLRFNNMLTTSPVPLTLLASMPCMPGDENKLHRQFADQRSHGEWFRPCAELAVVIAESPVQYGEKYRNVLSYLPGKAARRAEAVKATSDAKAEWKRLSWESRLACLFG